MLGPYTCPTTLPVGDHRPCTIAGLPPNLGVLNGWQVKLLMAFFPSKMN